MSATRYLGDRTRIVVTWIPRRRWDSAWNQGSYELVFYDAKKTREIWQPPGSMRPARNTTRRSLDLHIFVDRGGRGDNDQRLLQSPSLRGMDVTLGELGFVRPKMPTRLDHRGQPAVCEEYDLANIGCQSHEDCRKNRELSFACGAEQIKWIRAEDDAREKLLGSPQAIDAIVRIVLSKIANSSREQLGRDWFDTEGVRDDLAKYGVLALRRTESKPKGRSAGRAAGKDWAKLLAAQNLPEAPGVVIDARWVARGGDWWVRTANGRWHWFDPRKRAWKASDSGPR